MQGIPHVRTWRRGAAASLRLFTQLTRLVLRIAWAPHVRGQNTRTLQHTQLPRKLERSSNAARGGARTSRYLSAIESDAETSKETYETRSSLLPEMDDRISDRSDTAHVATDRVPETVTPLQRRAKLSDRFVYFPVMNLGYEIALVSSNFTIFRTRCFTITGTVLPNLENMDTFLRNGNACALPAFGRVSRFRVKALHVSVVNDGI